MGEQGPGVAQHLLARRGQRQPAGPLPNEQLGADLLLELADSRRDRGLCDVQLVGGLGHARSRWRPSRSTAAGSA